MNQNINNPGNVVTLPADALQQLLAQGAVPTLSTANPAMANMTFPGAGAVAAPETAAGNDGVTNISKEDLQKRVRDAAIAYGYVSGYIMNTAPRTTVDLRRSVRSTNGVNRTTYSVYAKQSKPSTVKYVLMSVPYSLVHDYDGVLMSPREIPNRLADTAYAHNPTPENLTKLHKFIIDRNLAAGYIAALGNALPDYAPNVDPTMTEHWSQDMLIHGSPAITWVTTKVHVNEKKAKVTAVKTKNKNSNGTQTRSNTTLSLRPKGHRKCLYAQGNIMCLRASETIKTDCKSADDERLVNYSAFETWTKENGIKDVNDSKTAKWKAALQYCSKLVFNQDYQNPTTGAVENGFGSVYFMTEKVRHVTDGKGGSPRVFTRQHLTYTPWYATGDMNTIKHNLQEIEYRVPKDTGKGSRAVIHTWTSEPEFIGFQPFNHFYETTVLSYTTADNLHMMCDAKQSAGSPRNSIPDPLSSTDITNVCDFFNNETKAKQAFEALKTSAQTRNTVGLE